MATGFAGFPPETLKFLRQLKRNNNREWFLANKDTYEKKVKAPMMDLVIALGGAMQNFAPELIVDPKRALFRIYRDTRFSKDKRPYKTHISALFAPRGVPKLSGASLYFHIEPAEVIVAGGVYGPDSATLRVLRQHVAAHWEDLLAITNRKDFKKLFGSIEGDQLKRPPLGFPPDHAAIDLLRHKQFYVSAKEKPSLAGGTRLFPWILTQFAAMMPLIRFLNAPLISKKL